jgi:hypothetical protein
MVEPVSKDVISASSSRQLQQLISDVPASSNKLWQVAALKPSYAAHLTCGWCLTPDYWKTGKPTKHAQLPQHNALTCGWTAMPEKRRKADHPPHVVAGN